MESSKPQNELDELIELAKKELSEETVYNDIDEFVFQYNIVSGKQRFSCIAFAQIYEKLKNKKLDKKYFEKRINPDKRLDGQVEINLSICLLNKDDLIGLSLEYKKRKAEKKRKEKGNEKKRLG